MVFTNWFGLPSLWVSFVFFHFCLFFISYLLLWLCVVEMGPTQQEGFEKLACNRLATLVSGLHELVQSAIPLGPCVAAVFKTLTKFFTAILSFVKYVSQHKRWIVYVKLCLVLIWYLHKLQAILCGSVFCYEEVFRELVLLWWKFSQIWFIFISNRNLAVFKYSTNICEMQMFETGYMCDLFSMSFLTWCANNVNSGSFLTWYANCCKMQIIELDRQVDIIPPVFEI